MNIRARFEEIWPVPTAVVWSDELGEYEAESSSAVLRSIRHNARLDTFIRCQETMPQKVIDAIRDVCELEPADYSNPECLMVTATDLGLILSRHFEGVE